MTIQRWQRNNPDYYRQWQRDNPSVRIRKKTWAALKQTALDNSMTMGKLVQLAVEHYIKHVKH